jgi:cytosine/adenosine deaminase-related metal-dependent hydrolase
MLVLCVGSIGLFACAAERRKAAEPSIAIVGATVVHPERDGERAVAPDSTIIIIGNRIHAVGRTGTIAIPAGSTIIDGRGKWVVPGLVDAHVHFFQSGNLYTRPDAADFNAWMPYAKDSATRRVCRRRSRCGSRAA